MFVVQSCFQTYNAQVRPKNQENNYVAAGKNEIQNVDKILFNPTYFGSHNWSLEGDNHLEFRHTQDLLAGGPTMMKLSYGSYPIIFQNKKTVNLASYYTSGALASNTNSDQYGWMALAPHAGDYVNSTGVSYGYGNGKPKEKAVTCDMYLGITSSLNVHVGYFSADDYEYEFTFTGQHYNRPKDQSTNFHEGLIVVSTGAYKNLSKNQEALLLQKNCQL